MATGTGCLVFLCRWRPWPERLCPTAAASALLRAAGRFGAEPVAAGRPVPLLGAAEESDSAPQAAACGALWAAPRAPPWSCRRRRRVSRGGALRAPAGATARVRAAEYESEPRPPLGRRWGAAPWPCWSEESPVTNCSQLLRRRRLRALWNERGVGAKLMPRPQWCRRPAARQRHRARCVPPGGGSW